LIFTDNGGTAANYDLVPSALTNGNAYQFVVTADRNGNAQLYIDGATSGSAVSISAESAVDIGSGNTNEYQFSNVMRDFRIFDKALSAQKVQDLYQTGKFVVTDDFFNGTSVGIGADDSNVNSSVGSFNSTVSIESGARTNGLGSFYTRITATGSFHNIRYSLGKTLPSGFKIRIPSLWILANGTYTSIAVRISDNSGLSKSNQFELLPSSNNTWEKKSDIFFTTTSSGGTQLTFLAIGATVSDYFEIDDLRFEITDCIVDLPLDEGIGYQFHDRSFNHFDALASTSGVTHLVPKTEGYIRDFNVDAYNGGSGNTELVDGSRDIIPSGSMPSFLFVKNNNTQGVGGTIALRKTAGGTSQQTCDTLTAQIAGASGSTIYQNSFSIDAIDSAFLSNTLNNLAVTASDADATDLDIRVDYKIIE